MAKILLTCSVCGKMFLTQACWAKKVKTPHCSRECNGAHRGEDWAKHGHKGHAAWTEETRKSVSEKMTGSLNPAWKGGATYRRRRGNYVSVKYVRCPAHLLPMARKDGYVMEHRLTMAGMAKRLLERVEVVHHLDHDPLNNAPTNLELWPSNQSHKSMEHGRVVEGVANRL